jgi:hypothetical protein
MLVICLNNQLVAPERVCCSCLLADKRGQPRWDGQRLGCAASQGGAVQTSPHGSQYECAMGFRVMNVP